MIGVAATYPRNRVATYGEVAAEYYDHVRHPTCASLRELSERYLIPMISAADADLYLVLEVGAGRSVVAPIWHSRGLDLRQVMLMDSSQLMLASSASWADHGAQLRVAEAEHTGLEEASVDLIVASLGDPYNTAAFWTEVARILRPGGVCHFTTPSHEWARRFRSAEAQAFAEFVRADGAVLLMPSPVYDEKEQVEMFGAAGLSLLDSEALLLSDLESFPAPKLLCVDSHEPVLRGYSVALL